ncbi:proline-rich protein 36 isoform X3 [Takifugu rubripes]|uniref:proline-rich protein 36 isoform X3 n=1 Tax=Takifugu rubripes TaxID=31033 RepID=UPI0011453104|nr:proline-rich protein 36-like isoform X3 [Takifugu rubripes]
MPVVERRRAAAPQWGNGPSRHQDFRHHRQPLALPGRPVGTWPPGGSCSARHEHGEPFYISFVSKAILWDRRLRHYPARERPYDCPSLCPRFLSHMKVHPEDHRPQCFQTSKSRRPPLFQGRTTNMCTLAPPDAKTQTLERLLNLKAENRRSGRLNQGRRPVLLPHLPVPSAPPPSTFNPTPPLQNTPFLNSEGQQVKVDSDGASPNNTHPPVDENIKAQTKEAPVRPVSLMESMKLHLKSSGPVCSPSPPSTLSQGSSSDYSQAPSSVFSRSTNLSGWISGLSADARDSEPERGAFSPLQPCLGVGSPLASHLSPGSSQSCSSGNIPNTSILCEPIFGQLSPLCPRTLSGVIDQSPKQQSEENLSKEASVHPPYEPCLDSDHGLATLEFPSTTWSSCPSPQRSTPQSGSGPGLTPSASVARMESHRWPVLPPISPVRGCCSSASSRSSELSCTQSHLFDELEAIAPRSPSCPSLYQPWDSPRSASPDTELSPGLAALTVGCQSGNLSSMSRVQLLLLKRVEPEDEEPSPSQDWSGFRMQYDAGLTSSGSSTDDEGSNYPGGRDGVKASTVGRGPDNIAEEDRRMEERKLKALNLLSKLHNDAPRLADVNKGLSNFEDFDFLAKYCIFSQEKLADYRRAFEEADSDGDGYISSIQALLALKNIVPAELLSEEEEIYVYRILEMVDFKVTDGLIDLRLFAVISCLAQKIATLDEFMRSLISSMDFHSLEARLFKVKQLFLCLLDEQRGDATGQQGFISPEQLLLELKAGGIHLEQEATILRKLRHIPPLDLLDFLAHLPLFMLIHNSVISNPFNDI